MDHDWQKLHDKIKNRPKTDAYLNRLQDLTFSLKENKELKVVYGAEYDENPERMRMYELLTEERDDADIQQLIFNRYLEYRSREVYQDFCNHVNYKTRFLAVKHPLLTGISLVSETLGVSQKLHIGTSFYRARVNNGSITGLKDMGAPPVGVASEGRINARGISVLYMADSPTTAISEIRPVKWDNVAIAKLHLKKELTILNFSFEGVLAGLIAENNDFTTSTLFHQAKIVAEKMSIPLTLSEKSTEYLPTQIIGDYVKLLGYDGICYDSSQHTNGKNYVFFDSNVLDFTHERNELQSGWVKDVSYDYQSTKMNTQEIIHDGE